MMGAFGTFQSLAKHSPRRRLAPTLLACAGVHCFWTHSLRAHGLPHACSSMLTWVPQPHVKQFYVFVSCCVWPSPPKQQSLPYLSTEATITAVPPRRWYLPSLHPCFFTFPSLPTLTKQPTTSRCFHSLPSTCSGRSTVKPLLC